MSAYLDAFWIVADLQIFLVIIGAACFGMFVGAIPGLTATMATALLVPVTFFMDPIPAIAAIVTAASMAIFAGDISGALLRIPGTPASAAYVEDSYALTQQGRGGEGLGALLICSAIGGIFGTLVLMFTAPQLAEVALRFSSFEYFWLVILGLSCAVFVAPGSALLGLLSLFIGLAFSMVGQNNPAAEARYTFGSIELLAGVQFVPAMIGLFAMSEVIRFYATPDSTNRPGPVRGSLFRKQLSILRRHPVQVLRGSALGTVVGALPGAGADIAAWISYAVSKKFSRTPEKFGKGHVEGLVEAGSSNNGALSGAWIPSLVFGIPGDSITAIVIGVLYVKGINPGPTIFITQPEMVYSVFLIFILANLVMLPLGWIAIRGASHLLSVPQRILMPIILLFCMTGAFAINNSGVGIMIMLGFGILGFLMEENRIPLAPAILGLVLGPMLEENFVSSMVRAGGSFMGFFDRPIAAGLGIATIAIWTLPLLRKIWRATRA